jgi:Glycosyl transferases group 1
MADVGKSGPPDEGTAVSGRIRAADFSRLLILEIGDKRLIKNVLPTQTTHFSTYFGDDSANDPQSGSFAVSSRTFSRLLSALRDPDLSLIVCHPTFFSPWHWRWLTRALFDRRVLQGHLPFVQAFGPQALRLPFKAPLAVLDFEDLPLINANNLYLLRRCRLYFKRELPVDRWTLFLKTAHANLPTPRFRRSASYAALLDKLRPISLGIPAGREAMLPAATEKTTDIFFAGVVEGSASVRARGMRELAMLRERGIVVDIPEGRLPPEEFYRRCAQAWLTWSPAGLGWDCFRHYEAAGCGSVPVINQPAIERHAPLLDRVHAVYYDIEEGGLTRAISRALADKAKLRAMAEAGRAHVMAHHTPAAIVRYVIGTTLGAARA